MMTSHSMSYRPTLFVAPRSYGDSNDLTRHDWLPTLFIITPRSFIMCDITEWATKRVGIKKGGQRVINWAMVNKKGGQCC
jgi:hypothetical protein